MYIHHAPINALSAHIIHINLNTMFYTHAEDSPTKTTYMRHYTWTHTHTQVQQQRPESPAVTLTWDASKYKVHRVH